MADERLRIKIEADAKRAEKELKTLSKLADELTEDELTILVDAKTEAATAELKRLTKLLASTEDPADIKVIMTGIKTATDQVEQLQKQVEKVDAETIDIKTDSTVRNLDNLEQSAGSSKSVLANMVGNTAQDLGALGGVAGSAGVAIGQMAEYMADASASGEGMGSIVRNFSKIIGPMIALSAATLAGTKAWEAYTTRTKETARLTKEASDALAEQTGVMDAIKADVEGGTDAWSQLNRAIAENTDEFPKAARALGALGVPVEDMSRTFADLEGNSRAALSSMAEQAGIPRDMAAAFAEAIDKGESWKEIFNLLQGTGLQGAAEAYKPIIEALEEVNDAQEKFDVETMAKNQLEAAAASEEWGDAVKQARFELRDGATELQTFQRFSRIQADTLAEQTAETAKATSKQELWRAEMDRSNEAFAEGQANAQAYADILASADWAAADLEGATTAMSAFTESQFEVGNQIQEQTDAWNTYAETVKGVGINMDTTTEKGAAQQDALEELAATIDTDLATAYTDAAGDAGTFIRSASDIADELRDKLRRELGLSDEQINEVLTSLGLMPDQINTRYTLSGVEEAKIKLDLLTGLIEDLPTDVKATVRQEIIAGDYVGALNTVQNYYDRHPVSMWIDMKVRKRGGSGEGGASGPGPAMMPPSTGPTTYAAPAAAAYGTTPAPFSAVDAELARIASRTVKVRFDADTTGLARAARAFATAAHTGRNIQSTTQRYVWRNGRAPAVP